MAAACKALDFPVVSGNVSLYNETRGPDGAPRAILPTPAIGGVGVLEDVRQAVGLALPPGLALVVVGETRGWLGQSLWLREVTGREDGAPPPVDLAAERRNGDFVRGRILAGEVLACHDVSDGGLLVAVAEMAMPFGTGVMLYPGPEGTPDHAFWFGEDQGRYVLAVADAAPLLAAARAAGVPAAPLGRSAPADAAAPPTGEAGGAPGGGGAGALVLPDGRSISVGSLRDAHEATLPALMAEA
jgi:phosphoribosylformylglycinamidine synthase subunit PurL